MSVCESIFRINVALNLKFYFAVDCPDSSYSGNVTGKVTALVTDLSKRFPESEGFKIEVTRWELRGKTVNL